MRSLINMSSHCDGLRSASPHTAACVCPQPARLLPTAASRFPCCPSPLFVSWHKTSRLGGDPRLRGCIGTLEPRPLHTAVRDYALTRCGVEGERGGGLQHSCAQPCC